MVKSIRIMCMLCVMHSIASAIIQADPVPGSIRLLPGYNNRTTQGIDSLTGMIWKKDGVKIHYDIGEMAGDYTDCATCGWTKGEVWRQKQIVSGQEVVLIFTTKRKLIISFPSVHANFYATVANNKELTDMILMVLTYQPPPKTS